MDWIDDDCYRVFSDSAFRWRRLKPELPRVSGRKVETLSDDNFRIVNKGADDDCM